MLAEERFALILNLLAEKRTATVQELCEALNASESTIRRDLTELARQGRLNRSTAVRPCRTASFWPMSRRWPPRRRLPSGRSAASRRPRQT